jgi:hypothetical protein
MFFLKKKFNNSSYSSDELNTLILFESYEKKKTRGNDSEQENISIKKPISED